MAEQLAFLHGITERDRILKHFADNHPLYLSLWRAYAREIAVHQGEVCIDDVREKAKLHDLPMPEDVGIDNRVLGAVFRCKDFEFVRRIESTRPERIARSGPNASFVGVYRLRG